MTSASLWLPVIWLFILASRPISLWFGGGFMVQGADSYLEGSPVDRNIFLLLIVLAFVVLSRRGMRWSVAFSANRWLFLFFIYFGFSALWSDYPFVSFKRWVKDIGNLVMVLVIVTEKNPLQAIIALLARITYFTVPISIVLIKYFPQFGRYLSSSWENTACGVATEKNALGCLAFLSGMFLVWDLIQMRRVPERIKNRLDTGMRWLLLLMVVWLLKAANSSTALVCFILGSAIIWVMHLPAAQRHVRSLGAYCVAAAAAIMVLYSIPGIFETFLDLLGEDVTLTGRTELWTELIKEDINPLLGTGYQGFWLGARLEEYWDRWAFHPNQAHNGYLETYLNGGLIALALLILVVIASPKNLMGDLKAGKGYGILRFGLFLIVLLYNWTEAMFNELSPIWFLFLFAVAEYPRLVQAGLSKATQVGVANLSTPRLATGV